MAVHQLTRCHRQIPDEDAELAAMLRRLAWEVERGQIGHLAVTLVRTDGEVERLGHVPTVTKIA